MCVGISITKIYIISSHNQHTFESFSPNLGHHQSAADLLFDIKEHYKHMPRMQGKNSIKTQKPHRHVKINYFGIK